MLSRRVCAGLTATLLIIEVLIAAFVHDAVIRPYVGDSLAIALVYFAIRAASGASAPLAAVLSLGVGVSLEFAQAWGLLARLGLSGNAVARIILGGSFDPRDFAAYAVGAIFAAGIDVGFGVRLKR